MTGMVPYDNDPTWKLESGESPKLFCVGCGEQVEHGQGFDTQHTVLDCLKVLHERLTRLESAKRSPRP